MINDLISLPPTSTTMPVVVRAEQRAPAASGPGASAAVAPPVDAMSARAVAPTQALDRATQAAARAVFAEREVEVTSFHDSASGRIVCTVADRRSGEVLMQSPPDALLRFFASTRAMLTEPLVAVDA